ncbi:MAG: DUF2817 domain-containing protein [Betaproteobacteria bacterium HGW-Betaproteobacteria-9]|jgi:hypothetical protein|nr:M14 family metallopeptidase [Hydrogenophaga sp.]PKO26501.1 MAG: DUF2817 domain-containing protein [Betaproteobacteria bacterium HGW-Betaproteobacteria-9]
MPLVDAFSASYAEARAKFLDAARSKGLEIVSCPHPLPGRDGEVLALDVARWGPADASRMLLVSSGCHGVEGYCGSGVQIAALRDEEWLRKAAVAGVTVLFLHAVNPYGFSHARRATHENIDLNRNFQDFGHPLPDNVAYRELRPLLVPATWPPSLFNKASIAWYIARRGMKAFQAAVSGGQYAFADGLFYGGREPSWSNVRLRQVLRTHAGQARQLGWIDLHTGLGPTGHGELLYAGRPDDAAGLARSRAWWDGPDTPLKSLYDGSSVSARVTGQIWGAVYDECPQAEITSLAIEFGTQPLRQVLQALRAEQWLQNHPGATAAQAAQIKRDLRHAFYVDTPDWKRRILAQSFQAMDRALQGLTAA